jgi:hypothetical protein
MEPEDEKTITIARRTRKNLDFIYTQKAQGADVEEFTHLLNSMLGMVICLREKYLIEKNVTWEDIGKQYLQPASILSKNPTKESPNLKPHNSFSKLISNVRHALAHNCFDLQCNKKKLTGVVVWNVPTKKPNKPENRTWEAEIPEEQLKMLAYSFIDYVEKILV